MTIQFICRGNAFRSIIAQAYLNSLNIPNLTVLSSGTVASLNRELNRLNFSRTLTLLQKHGIRQYAKDHFAEDIDKNLLDKTDIVVCLNKVVYAEAESSFKLPKKTYIWDVTDLGEKDRIATSDAEREIYSEDVYKEIVKNVNDLASLIVPQSD